MPINKQPSRKISDAEFSQTLTLREAYRVMETFTADYLGRGDTPVSEFLFCHVGLCADREHTADPASLSDFLLAWQKIQNPPNDA